MEETGGEVICGALTTLAGKGQLKVIDKMVSCMMTDSSSENEDGTSLLAIITMSFEFAHTKEDTRIDDSAIFV